MNKKERASIEAQAEKLIKRGKIQDAILEYQKLLTGDEQDIPVKNIIGDLYVRSEQKRKAVKEFQAIADFYEKKGLHSKSIAILKRINRIDPSHLDSVKKLAHLYHDQGFSSEARAEYAKLATALEKQNKSGEAEQIYEKLIKLSPEDMDSRRKLADLYKKAGKVDQAVEEYNVVAEYDIRKKNLESARANLNEAKKLKDDYARTLTNLIDLFKRENKKKEALNLVNEILKKDKENVKALHLLGNLYLEDKSLKEAEDIFSKIILVRPKDVDARVKLGRICIERDELDKAFEIYEPLIDTLIRKQKEDKAMGLLGLILSSKKAHIPTLEKLASLYKQQNQKKNLEITYSVLIEQYQKNNLREKVLTILGELVKISPENEKYYHAHRQLKEELGIADEEVVSDEVSIRLDEAQEIIETSLAKADLYVEQGLVRNAKRMLENLKMRFPDEPKIDQKLAQVKTIADKGKLSTIEDRMEKVREKETQLFDHLSPLSPGKKSGRVSDAFQDDRLTAADIFAETDLIPLVIQEDGKEKYYDLKDIISDELEAIRAVYNSQMRGDTTIVEKALTDIVADFRKALDEKVDSGEYDTHYNLGIAFMEQGLYNEAIEECKMAAKSKKLEIDSYSVISQCYKQKKDFQEALKWIEKAQQQADKGSDQDYALMYELATILEELGDYQKALSLFQDVNKWNPEYRDIAKKVTVAEKKT